MLLKLFVLVRKDLSKSQQAVQAGHAIAQYLIEHPDTEWGNGTLVLLRVPFESFDYWQKTIGKYSIFREPDIGNEMTAIACVGNDELFSDLPLV